jgi:hypothetical protein
MALFDFARAGTVRQQILPSSIIYSPVLHDRRTPQRAGLGSIRTLLVLMGVAMGVLSIRFILVFAHTVLQ